MNFRDASALVHEAVYFEEQGEFERAVESFMVAASGLRAASASETDPKIQQLVLRKSLEVERWATDLYAWLEAGKKGRRPVRRAASVDHITHSKLPGHSS
ncbi:unnamed protein product [Aphanomyces euteiches]|uniref:Uncharacterized protein n=1 Tax=Aphanomyces euteiches TaxID=100861 RepID=A0A6G0W767_9STRA|nr:hypothetical protein Ae201684_018249 [Aphanomyces euteiches]KAH9069204.1 hypothetical protein Ae201684P_004894 [Aphanomyces euteiches]KAH9139375.1 hypothetical protein AeRB84_016350 [Aphanomyces euteiches]